MSFGERVPGTLKGISAAVAYVAVVGLTAALLTAVIPRGWVTGAGDLATTSVLVVLSAFAVNAIMVRRGWVSWRRLGWPRWHASVRGFATGLGLGTAMAIAAIVLAVGLGGSLVSLTHAQLGAYVPAAAKLVVLLVAAALAEELLFRGYPLARLTAAVGKLRASVGLAVVFSLAHVANPDLSALGLANIALAALVLSAAFFTAGAMPAAWGLHVGWNGGLALVADAPVSGLAFDLPAVEYAAGQPIWWTGGAFGPEGGFVATTAMVVALMTLVRRSQARKEEVDAP